MTLFRRFLLTVFLVVLAIAVIVALFYAEENWRGHRAWTAAQTELQAKGENLEWSHSVPPPVPDDQNLAMAPFYARALHYQTDPKTGVHRFGPGSSMPTDLKEMPYAGVKPAFLRLVGWDRAIHTDLPALARYFQTAAGFPHPPQLGDPAADVLTALARYAPALEEVARAAATRPFTRFPVQWQAANPFAVHLPQDNLQQQLVTTLRLRASAHLASGRAADALRDLDLGFRLIRALPDEPTLIAHLVEITCLNIELTPIWEALDDRRWTGIELLHLQQELAGFDLLADYRHAMRGERAFAGARGIDYMADHPADVLNTIDNLSAESEGWPKASAFRPLARVIPRGWFDLNKALTARFMQTYFVEAVNPATRRVFPASSAAAERTLTALRSQPVTIAARILLPVYVSISRRAARSQTSLDEAVVACALERFYLERKSYPIAVAELVPAYLPRVPTDLIDGQPLRYAQTSDGRYRLYGIGWNGRDDRGQVAWRKSDDQLNHLDDEVGDWVWQYEPLQLPSAARPGK